MSMPILAIVTISRAGHAVATRLAETLAGEVIDCDPEGAPAAEILPRLFAEGRPIIGVCAAGILIRLLAPVLADKRDEPPVLAVAIDGSSAVPLLGGHHGANTLARQVAALFAGHAAITTASEARFARALDEPPPGYALANPDAARAAMMALVQGAAIALRGEMDWLAAAGYPIAADGAVAVRVTEHAEAPDNALLYHPKTLVAGVGCERGAAADEVIALVERALAAENLSRLSLAALASIDIKADEPALAAAAAYFSVPLRLFTAAELAAERDRLTNPSAYVEATVGTPAVAEAAALKAGPLVGEKLKSQGATCAIGRAAAPIDPETLGRAPGRLHLVGIGPGDAATRTGASIAALKSSSDWVGYGLYLDLVADLRTHQAEHRFELGDEEPRVRHALELAAEGREVALICSGDAQIYAMAALALELLDQTGPRAVSNAARRVNLEIHPGVSAFQAASAAAGALIGHDFCCISLSDLLTPRDAILSRLEAAAAGDFVTAFYNPRSRRRLDLLDIARDIFQAHRPPDTPVIVASNLGRPAQQVRVIRLDAFDPAEVDMLTIVLIGASTSRILAGPAGPRAYTPRGYEKKALTEPA